MNVRALLIAMMASAVVFEGFAPVPAAAQSWPSRTVTIVVPFPPGGGVDVVARIVAERLSTSMKASLMLDYAEFSRRRQALVSFSDLAAYHERSVLVSPSGRTPELRRAAHVTANLARVMRLASQHGRDFDRRDEQPGAADVVLLSDRAFERLFDRDPGAVGRTLRVDERTYEVIGVMPPGWSQTSRSVGCSTGKRERSTRCSRRFPRAHQPIIPTWRWLTRQVS